MVEQNQGERRGVNIAFPPFLSDLMRRAVHALQADPVYRFKNQAHDRLIELGLPVVSAGGFPDIYGGQVPGEGEKAARSTIYPLEASADRLEALMVEMKARGLPWSEFTALSFRAMVIAAGCGVVLSGGQDAGGLVGQK